MRVTDIMDRIEATSSRLKKEQILQENESNELLREYLWYALNPYKTYHLANITCPPSVYVMEMYQPVIQGLNVQEALEASHFHQLWELLGMLDDGSLSGNEARVVVNQFLAELPEPEQKWAYRCLLKDLKAGVTSKTVNKILKKDLYTPLIPEFSVALAETLEFKEAKLTPEVTYPVWVDNKLDGIRAVCVKKNGKVTFYTRKGHVIETLPTLAKIIEEVPNDDFVLDGEVMGRSWNESQSTVFATKNTVDDTSMFYNVFDAMTVGDWEAQQCPLPYMQRKEHVRDILRAISHTQIRQVGGQVVKNTVELYKFYRDAVSGGFEGVMVKDMKAPYAFKRSRALMKLKPKHTWEGRVVGWEKGALNSKYDFGAFRVEINGVITFVGGGFTDEMRDEIWKNIQTNATYYSGWIAEVEGQDMTEDGKIRFPVFKRWRSEKDQ